MRRHGWQRPLHNLQFVGMAVYTFLVAAFYTFLGLFLGTRTTQITVTAIFSFVAFSVMLLFIRCTGTDPTDKTSFRMKKTKCNSSKLNYGYILGQIVMRFLRRVERNILRTFIRRTYLDPWKTGAHMEPLLPFPLVVKEDALSPDPKEDDISFCSLCDFEVKKHSKHCRTCNRCVEGFDHHCKWLNNCVGKRNYTTFILLMIFLLLMLIIEGGTAVAVFIRCFADKKGIQQELDRKLSKEFPRGLLAAIAVLLVLVTAYSSAALGQLFFFHVVLIRKGIRTYDYILAMRAESQSMELESFYDSDSSDESTDFDSPEKSTFVSRFLRRGHRSNQNPNRLSIRIDGDPKPATLNKKAGFHVSIDPWKLIKFNREKAEKSKEKLVKQRTSIEYDSLKPLPLETRCGPSSNPNRNKENTESCSTPLVSKGRIQGGSPGRLSSPRRRFSSSSTKFSGIVPSPKHKYRSNFDLKLTEVSRELETYISRQVLCSVIKKDAGEASPR